jgi:heme A synthase
MDKKFFKSFSWFLVGYNVMVIIWGAVVRSTGSGAGCGNHWPLCNGEIIPQFEKIETAIELFHRITSTVDGFLVIFLVILANRLFGSTFN